MDGNDVVLAFKMDNLVGDGEANENNDAKENKDTKGGKIHPLVRVHVRTASSVSGLQTDH